MRWKTVIDKKGFNLGTQDRTGQNTQDTTVIDRTPLTKLQISQQDRMTCQRGGSSAST